MQKTLKISFLFLLLSSKVFSQNETIVIRYSYYNQNDQVSDSNYAELICSNNKSLFTIHNKIIDSKTKYIDEKNRVTGDLMDNTEIFFKDYHKNLLLTKSKIPLTKNLILKDSLNNCVWILTEEKKTILEYECTQARTTYHGRNYIAYYTESIPIPDGPWKLGKLPGIILELKEESGMLEIMAEELKILNQLTDIKEIYELDEAFFWTELLEKAKAKLRIFNIEAKKDDPTSNSRVDSSNFLEVFDINE